LSVLLIKEEDYSENIITNDDLIDRECTEETSSFNPLFNKNDLENFNISYNPGEEDIIKYHPIDEINLVEKNFSLKNITLGIKTEKQKPQSREKLKVNSPRKDIFNSGEKKSNSKKNSISNNSTKKKQKRKINKQNKLVDLIAFSYQMGNYDDHLNKDDLDYNTKNFNHKNHNTNSLYNIDEKNLSINLSTSIIEYDNPEKNLNLLKEKIREINDNFAVVNPIKKIEDLEELNRNYFRLININAPVKSRYENFKKKHLNKINNKLESDIKNNISDFETFLKKEEEYYKRNSDIKQIQTLANYHISNDSGLDDFFRKLDILSSTLHKTFRPNWDDYFMKITHAVSERSNCMKQRIGAILVKNLRIISTGYNGMSSSLGNCYLGNCPRCNIKTKQGENLHNCICIHAEESAVNLYFY